MSGLLKRPDAERNTMERLTLACLQHLCSVFHVSISALTRIALHRCRTRLACSTGQTRSATRWSASPWPACSTCPVLWSS